MYSNIIKPIAEVIIALVLFVILLPLFVSTILLLFIANRGKVFFFQKRPGKNEKIFHIIKFKTMTDKTDSEGNILPDEKRMTVIGSIVRKFSLDEIPQLLNVIFGKMALVGPRPLLPEYLPLYNDFQKRRHEVKPGITGWAQVNGRNAITWEKKFELDIYYVNNISLIFDLKILWLTILKVRKSEGINSNTSATMEKFTGTINGEK